MSTKKIISVSYKDDTPAFFSEEFFNDLRNGYRMVSSRYGNSRVSLKPEDVFCFVFWTKNCSDHFIENMKNIQSPFYIQWTITGYDKDMESMVPDKKEVMDRFIAVSNIVGPDNVIWRYDPILMNDKYTVDYHIRRFEEMVQYLKGYTNRCVISFFDEYGKISREIRSGLMRKPTDEEVKTIASAFSKTAAKTGMKIQTCAERGYDLSEYGILEGPCVDPDYIEKICGDTLPASLRQTDSFRRCNCAVNTDIGNYHRCKHDCKYCYAK